MTLNRYHPGRPDYTGPDYGIAGYVHHNQQVEYCWSFKERLAVIDTEKPECERAIRRRCLTYLGKAPRALRRARAAYDVSWATYHEAVADLDQWATYKQAVIAYRKAKAAYNQAVAAHLTSARMAKLMVRLQRLTPDAPWQDGCLRFPKPAQGRRAP